LTVPETVKNQAQGALREGCSQKMAKSLAGDIFQRVENKEASWAKET
jgi:hypothetical protein